MRKSMMDYHITTHVVCDVELQNDVLIVQMAHAAHDIFALGLGEGDRSAALEQRTESGELGDGLQDL